MIDRRKADRPRKAVWLCQSAIGLLAGFLCVLANNTAAAQEEDKRTMEIEDLFRLERLGGFDVDPSGAQVVYAANRVDLTTNKSVGHLYLAPLTAETPDATQDRSGIRQLTSADARDANPVFLADGEHVVFESNRSGSNQLWAIRISGGEAYQLTDHPMEVSGPVISGDGLHVVVESAVYPDITEGTDEEIAAANAARSKAEDADPVKVRTADHLFWRHWDSYVGHRRRHLLVGTLALKDGRLTVGPLHDATPGDRDAVPTSSTFASGQDYTFTPDGRHLVFTAVPSDAAQPSLEAYSTNYDLCHVAIDNRSPQWNTLTSGNQAADSGPRYSPDGKFLAWRTQKTPGFEADKWQIAIQPVGPYGTLQGERREVTLMDDVSIDQFAWVDNSQVIAVTQWEGRHRFYRIFPTRNERQSEILATDLPSIGDLQTTSGGALVYSASSFVDPGQIYLRTPTGNIKNVSGLNQELLRRLNFPQVEHTAVVPIEDGYRLQMWIVKPPNFDPNTRYPTVYMVHGGPQGAWNDGWSFRWNPVLWAAQGYVVVLPNPRGSTGFGQAFVNQISGDWGGKVYRDLMAGFEHVAQLPYVDADRIAAAGASFGGYMMNWFAVNTDRFCTLVSHCSVYNFESMYGTTDELWFDEYEHGGVPWAAPEKYRQFSPHAYAAKLAEYRTPMLIIHNDLDFRCPIGQGIELFTTLQRQGVPSRFVNFPDEGHWVVKPANSQRWHEEIFRWLDKYCKQASASGSTP